MEKAGLTGGPPFPPPHKASSFLSSLPTQRAAFSGVGRAGAGSDLISVPPFIRLLSCRLLQSAALRPGRVCKAGSASSRATEQGVHSAQLGKFLR